MSKKGTIIISIASFFIFIASILTFYIWWCSDGSLRHAEKIAIPIIEKIENYKEINGKTPDSFVDLGFAPDDIWGGMRTEIKGIDYWYEKISDTDYLIYFDISLGEAMYYHSYTKKWDSN